MNTHMKYLTYINKQQYLLERGKVFSIDKIPNKKENDTLKVDNIVMSYDDQGKVNFNDKTTLEILIKKIYKEDKIIVFKKRRRKDSQTKNGHRQYKMLISVK